MKKLNRMDLKNLMGGSFPDDGDGGDGGACSITCDKGKFACCNGGFCACFDDGSTGQTCGKGGPGSSTCSQ